MAYCSPKQTDNYKKFKSCFDKPALLRIAESLNQAHARPITNLKGLKTPGIMECDRRALETGLWQWGRSVLGGSAECG